MNGLQRRTGAWLSDFSRLRREPGFDLGKNLEEIITNNGNGAGVCAKVKIFDIEKKSLGQNLRLR